MRTLLGAVLLLAAAVAQAQPTVSTWPYTCAWCDIGVTWSGIASPSAEDRLALTTPSSTTFINWRYTNGAASGTLMLNVPGSTPFGNYVIRFYSGSTNIATSAPFEVRPFVNGTVSSGGSPLAGVSYSATNVQCSGVTDASGYWGCVIPVGWSGTVTVSKAGSLFTPASRSYTNVTNIITGENFATAATHAVSGTITRGGVALSGVAVAGSNGASCTSTNASGQYTCAVLPGWSGTVTPSLAQHTFTPASRSYTSVSAAQSAQDYTAQAFPQVSGTITFESAALSGVSIAGSNGASCSSTNASGQYTCHVPPGWSGTVTPSLTDRVFTPASRSYTNVTAAQPAQDYLAYQSFYQVSGSVTLNGLPLVNVALAATGGPTCSSTNGAGQYSCTVPFGWSGSVTPSASGYSFSPVDRSYTSVAANQSAQTFTASLDTATAPLYFVHVDHLNTPRLVANTSGTPVWRWDQQEPLGTSPADENPSSLGAFEFPLRFPGQYEDKETNLFYNYFRDYDPGIGRYPQSDPIGPRGGLNTYGYVDGNSLRYADPEGLQFSWKSLGIAEGGSLGWGGAFPTFKYGLGLGGAAGIEVRTCCGADNMLYREFLLVGRGGLSVGGSNRFSPSALINLVRMGPMATCMVNYEGTLGLTSVDIQIGSVVTSTDLTNLRMEAGLTTGAGPGAGSAVLNLLNLVHPLGKQPLNKCC